MSRDSDAPRLAHRVAATLSALAPVLFTALFIDVIAVYWAYLGVDTPGAGFALIGLYAPVAFVGSLAAALLVFFCSRRRLIGPWQSLGLTLPAVVATLALGFAFEAHRMSGYPRGGPTPSVGFFRFYMQHLTAAATPRPNQAMQLTASKPDVHAWSACRRARMLRSMHRGPAAADLVTR